MASPPIKPLDGPGGYLRWKESMLLRAHTLGVARVLFEDPTAGGDSDEAAAKKWARDNAICRGHILATLSDRLLPDYARHATARALWEAVARTYDPETSHGYDKFTEFCFDEGGHFLEQLTHAGALGAAAELSDEAVASELRSKLPVEVRTGVALRPSTDKKGMSLVWEMARRVVSDTEPERIWRIFDESTEDEVEEDQQQGKETVCWTCGKPGHFARDCSTVPGNASAGLDQGKAMDGGCQH